jgi:prepilin-type N-terminal cleavage/methylation domain-containing protein
MTIRGRRTSRGFTLVEITIAVVIVGLLTAAVSLSFSRPIDAARAHDAVDRVRAFDESARALARRSGRAVDMTFDLYDRALRRRHNGDETSVDVTLPRGCAIDRFRSPDRDIATGEATVTCSALGLSRSYAAHLTGPALDCWVVVAGLTGQTVVVTDEQDVEQIFRAAQPSRHDAD